MSRSIIMIVVSKGYFHKKLFKLLFTILRLNCLRSGREGRGLQQKRKYTSRARC
ncbi:MAG: hypothetical protein ACTS73_03450 [Arsenophonus sp. NEOnobi-MAG3]